MHVTLGMFNVPAMNVSCVSQFLVYEGCAFLTSPFVRFGWCCDHTEFQLRFHSEGRVLFSITAERDILTTPNGSVEGSKSQLLQQYGAQFGLF